MNTRIPALDGLRGLAVLLVVAHHASVPGFELGGLGVDIFFVLSGFLITSILAADYQRHGRVRLGAFYARRAVRLLPALLLLFALTLPALMALGSGPLRDTSTHAAASALVWAGNWAMLADPSLWGTMFAHLWSLAIEDQFYILWAPLLPLLLSRVAPARAARILLALAALSSAWAALAAPWLGTYRAYLGTDTRAQGLLVGCALGILYVHGRLPAGVRYVRLYGLGTIMGVGLVALLAFTGLASAARAGGYSTGLVYPAVALATACLVAFLLAGGAGRVNALLCWYPLRWFGLISYGLYLWHYPVMWLMRLGLGISGGAGWLVLLLVAAPLSVGIAAASYYFVERPLLQRHSSKATLLSSRKPAPAALPGSE